MRAGYEVFWIAGERDGETLGIFETSYGAEQYAAKMWEEHEDEFDPCFGGIGIIGPDGKLVEW